MTLVVQGLQSRPKFPTAGSGNLTATASGYLELVVYR